MIFSLRLAPREPGEAFCRMDSSCLPGKRSSVCTCLRSEQSISLALFEMQKDHEESRECVVCTLAARCQLPRRSTLYALLRSAPQRYFACTLSCRSRDAFCCVQKSVYQNTAGLHKSGLDAFLSLLNVKLGASYYLPPLVDQIVADFLLLYRTVCLLFT